MLLPGFKHGKEVPLVGSLPSLPCYWDTWDFASLCKEAAAVSFWECESLPGTPTEVSPRTGGDDWISVPGRQNQLWALRRHCEILEPDQRSGPDHYCNTSRGSTAHVRRSEIDRHADAGPKIIIILYIRIRTYIYIYIDDVKCSARPTCTT